MDLQTFITSIGVNLTSNAISALCSKFYSSHQDINSRLNNPQSDQDFEDAKQETIGIIKFYANSGEISIDVSDLGTTPFNWL